MYMGMLDGGGGYDCGWLWCCAWYCSLLLDDRLTVDDDFDDLLREWWWWWSWLCREWRSRDVERRCSFFFLCLVEGDVERLRLRRSRLATFLCFLWRGEMVRDLLRLDDLLCLDDVRLADFLWLKNLVIIMMISLCSIYLILFCVILGVKVFTRWSISSFRLIV